MAASKRSARKPRYTATSSSRGGIKVKTTDKDMGWAPLMKLLKDMGHQQTRVVVGVTGKKAEALHPRGKGKTVVDIAVQNEFGSPGGKIPERSFIRSTTDANAEKYKAGIRRGFRDMIEDAVTKGQVDPAKAKGMERLGLQVTGDIKRAISDGIPPPNAPSTIAHKGSDTPLIDTGRLRQSISHEVRRGRK